MFTGNWFKSKFGFKRDHWELDYKNVVKHHYET
jgi:hypothetical protein